MAVQNFDYTKISELPLVSEVDDEDVLVINHTGRTSKIKYSALKDLISATITADVDALEQRVNTLTSTTSELATTVADHTGTINNIITAGFNLIGID